MSCCCSISASSSARRRTRGRQCRTPPGLFQPPAVLLNGQHVGLIFDVISSKTSSSVERLDPEAAIAVGRSRKARTASTHVAVARTRGATRGAAAHLHTLVRAAPAAQPTCTPTLPTAVAEPASISAVGGAFATPRLPCVFPGPLQFLGKYRGPSPRSLDPCRLRPPRARPRRPQPASASPPPPGPHHPRIGIPHLSLGPRHPPQLPPPSASEQTRLFSPIL